MSFGAGLHLVEVDADEVLASVGAQEEFFYRMCPDQVEVGSNKPRTFDWILGRTRDGSATNAPREFGSQSARVAIATSTNRARAATRGPRIMPLPSPSPTR